MDEVSIARELKQNKIYTNISDEFIEELEERINSESDDVDADFDIDNSDDDDS
jgi:frataxin-like iron-binding protein CyaY